MRNGFNKLTVWDIVAEVISPSIPPRLFYLSFVEKELQAILLIMSEFVVAADQAYLVTLGLSNNQAVIGVGMLFPKRQVSILLQITAFAHHLKSRLFLVSRNRGYLYQGIISSHDSPHR